MMFIWQKVLVLLKLDSLEESKKPSLIINNLGRVLGAKRPRFINPEPINPLLWSFAWM